MSFYLNADIEVVNSMGEKNLSFNHFKIDFFNNVDEQVLLMPNQKEYQFIDIVLRVGVLHNLIQQMEFPDPIQKDLLQGLEQQQSNYYPLPLSLKEQIIELWDMKENGVFQLLSLQSKTSQVLYRLLEIFQSNTTQNDCKKLIEEVQHIIHNRLDNPPTIKELSKAVGINESKLKKEFKQQCKQTIFQYN